MGRGLSYDEILQLLSDEDLENELNWCRNREKESRRKCRWGTMHWYAKHSHEIVLEMGRRQVYEEPPWVQLALDIPGRVAPELRVVG